MVRIHTARERLNDGLGNAKCADGRAVISPIFTFAMALTLM